jgi:PAS domain S-box-containing protein
MSDTYWTELAGALFEEAGDALFLFDPETEQLCDVNPMAQRLSGFTRREMVGMKITYLIRSEAEGGLHRLRLAFRRTGLFHSQEGFWLRHNKDGTWVPVNLTATRLHAEARPLGLITARDITERKQAEEVLRQSEERYRKLFETSILGIIVHQDDIIRAVNASVLRIFGYSSAAELVGKNLWTTLVAPQEMPEMNERTTVLLRGETLPIHPGWQGIRKDGSPVWVQATANLITWHGKQAICGYYVDVTERKLAEEAVRAGEAKYRSLIENLTQSIFLKDRHLRYVAANRPFCQSVGLESEDQIIGKDDHALYPPDLAEQYRNADRLVLQEGRRLELEEKNLIGGKPRTVQKVKSPVRDDHGEIVGVLGIFWDVTDQRNLEAQLRQAHKMEAVGQLAGGIAHDFNNLLTGILGNLSLALNDLPKDHPVVELLSSAEVAALRAAELTRQLLGFSRRAPLVPQPLDLGSISEETVRLLRRTFDPRIDIQMRKAVDLWPIDGDASQIGQVVLNLCLNARDAMPTGGRLVVETGNIRLDEAPLGSIDGRPGDFVRLRIRDSGIGMSPDVQERIFEPFFTTKEPGKGTGLGLAMVFGIVKQHHGWVECHSEVERGTTFDIYLPRLAVAAAPTTPPSEDGVRGGSETILLADDEEVVGRLGQTILERQGYRVMVANDGVEAVELYRRERDAIALVVLDLAMPRLSGPETLRELRQINPDVAVLVSSGYSSDEDMRTVERDGVLGFVAKPYRPADLIRRVRAALDQLKRDGAMHKPG